MWPWHKHVEHSCHWSLSINQWRDQRSLCCLELCHWCLNLRLPALCRWAATSQFDNSGRRSMSRWQRMMPVRLPGRASMVIQVPTRQARRFVSSSLLFSWFPLIDGCRWLSSRFGLTTHSRSHWCKKCNAIRKKGEVFFHHQAHFLGAASNQTSINH